MPKRKPIRLLLLRRWRGKWGHGPVCWRTGALGCDFSLTAVSTREPEWLLVISERFKKRIVQLRHVHTKILLDLAANIRLFAQNGTKIALLLLKMPKLYLSSKSIVFFVPLRVGFVKVGLFRQAGGTFAFNQLEVVGCRAFFLKKTALSFRLKCPTCIVLTELFSNYYRIIALYTCCALFVF